MIYENGAEWTKLQRLSLRGFSRSRTNGIYTYRVGNIETETDRFIIRNWLM